MSDVETLLTALASASAVERQEAREGLATIGSPAVPGLVEMLSDPNEHLRWEAAKTLTAIADPAAAPQLARTLGDESTGVRWVAGEALLALGPRALEPLLDEVIESRNVGPLLEGAHHVLHDISQRRRDHFLAPLLDAFRAPEPEIAVPVAAKPTLEALRA